ncbi:MAG: SpoIIE family protein phosphatase [Acidimicrobiales bacterium]|jgi:PAS domain S-box-containing protein
MISSDPRPTGSTTKPGEPAGESRVGDEGAVWQLASELAGAVSPAAVASAVAEHGAAAAGATFANMGIRDAGSDVVRVVHRSVSEPDAALRWKEFPVDERTEVGEAIRTGLPVLVGSIESAERRFPEAVDDFKAAGLSARASFPLHSSSGQVLGAVGFGWREPQDFEPAQLRRIDLIAQLAYQALERSLHFEGELWRPASRQHTFEAGAPISPAIAARWFHAIYQVPMLFSGILDSTGKVLDANFLSVEGCGLVREATVGYPFWEGGWWSPDPELAAENRGWCEQVLRSGESLRVTTRFFVGDGTQRMAEVALYPLFDEGSSEVSYIVAVGLDITDAVAAQREREARIEVEAAALRQIDAARRHELFAVHASEEQSRERLARLAGAAMQLLHAESTRDLATIVDRGIQVLGADGGVIVAREGDEFRVAVSEQIEQNFHAQYDHLPLDNPLPGIRVARSGERVVLPDRRTGLAFTPQMAQVYEDTGRQAWAFVPLRVGDRLLGSLAVSWVDERDIDENELELIEAFAAQSAQALDRIRATRAERQSARRVQNMVKAFQQSLLSKPRAAPGLDIAARYVPAFEDVQVGGDWYDAFVTDDGRMIVSVGDVAGHDGDAAAMMAQLRNLLRGLAIGTNRGPAALLARLDEAIANLGLRTIATALVAQIGPGAYGLGRGQSRVQWSSAGHPPPMVRTAEGRVTVLFDQPDLLLGARSRSKRTERTFDLPAGATLLMFTDGLVERRDEVLDSGLARLAAVFADVGDGPLELICDEVVSAMVPGEPNDDVALMVVRRLPLDGQAPGSSLRDG